MGSVCRIAQFLQLRLQIPGFIAGRLSVLLHGITFHDASSVLSRKQVNKNGASGIPVKFRLRVGWRGVVAGIFS